MEADLAARYQTVRAAAPARPDAAGLLALWLDQFTARPLRDEAGRAWTVVQPGVPESTGGLRLAEAVLRAEDGELRSGPVTVGGAAPAIDLLAVVWEPGEVSGPHVALRDQLAAPWPELAPLLETPAPDFSGGSALSVAEPLPLVRAAGLFRLRRKARRLKLRRRAVGLRQLLWEELAGALGYHRNQAPFRHLARRLPASLLEPLEAGDRAGLLFGVAGLLPEGDLRALPAPAQDAARILWDRWWKARAAFDYAVLPASSWSRTQIRPANRPERRLAALAVLLPHLDRLERAVARRDAAAFARVCAEAHDPFWSRHAAWKGKPAPKPLLLVGAERLDDLVHNLFWPLVAQEDPDAAAAALEALPAAESRPARQVRELLFGDAPARPLRRALFQQGLLELRRDAPGAKALERLAGRFAS
ncbi:MAG: DUF2851 family protein [Verrucomicrobium sp.]|nr:DUF2851 family protein [Verrucomicrobium sp.]